MIKAIKLQKKFGSFVAVNNVSLAVEKGSVVGFLGPNGAGKSTTMRLLSGVWKADSGNALICDYDISKNRIEAQSLLGYLPEAPGGFGVLTVREFLVYCGQCRGLWQKKLKKTLEHAADIVDLGPALSKKMSSLSKGWRQRAWLAQAILHDPPVLILDEPTDGLDPNQKEQVRTLIKSIAKEKAIILSTHILEEVEEVCDRVIVIAEGKIVADDTPDGLADKNGRIAATFRKLTARYEPKGISE